MTRDTAAGSPDATFGANGTVTFNRIVENVVATLDGGGLLEGGKASPITVERRTAAGTRASATTLATPFGGGSVAPLAHGGSARQTRSGHAGAPRRRLVPGHRRPEHLRVDGERSGCSAPFFAAAAFTLTLTLDRSFGGAQSPARATGQFRRQRARTAATRGSVSLRVTAPEAGLVFLRVRDGRGRILASGAHPVFAAGPKIMSVRLTTLGRRVLRRIRKGAADRRRWAPAA